MVSLWCFQHLGTGYHKINCYSLFFSKLYSLFVPMEDGSEAVTDVDRLFKCVSSSGKLCIVVFQYCKTF